MKKGRTHFPPLKNRYYLMRHGRSLANERGLIISNLSTGTGGWGLKTDALPEIIKSIEKYPLPGNTMIYSSPFLRAVETAAAAAHAYRCPSPVIAYELRERFFGDYEEGPDSRYPEVWHEDELNSGNCAGNVESPSAVLKRMIRLIADIEARFGGSIVLLVSHGDPLNILLTGAAGFPPGRHRNIQPMKTGEIRPLLSDNASSSWP